jgi:hypothetical protein
LGESFLLREVKHNMPNQLFVSTVQWIERPSFEKVESFLVPRTRRDSVWEHAPDEESESRMFVALTESKARTLADQ